MTSPPGDSLERRILVLAPTGRDAELTQTVLFGAGLRAQICPDAKVLCQQAGIGAGALLVAEEAITPKTRPALVDLLADQPPWSDLPFLVLTRRGANSPTVHEALVSLGNITLIERPVRVSALTSAVHSALRGRERQYQIRSHLELREQAEQSLRDADRRKDEFLAMLAHELRNPLAPISNSLQIMRLTGGSDHSLEGLRALMERQVNHMVRLVDDLLEVARITRGKIELRLERIDLRAVLRNAIETNKPLIEAAGHELVLALPDEPLMLDGDPVRLAQIFTNLLNNATKFTQPPGRISIAARREGPAVVVSVKDTGMGIPQEMLARVFDLFAQIQGEPREQRAGPGGLGIGLTLVRNMVEMHGGSVVASSEGLGRGSEFVVRLPPAGRAAPARGSVENGLGGAPAAAVRVLVVDDNRDAADSLGTLLRCLGAEACVTHDGSSALEALETFRPALVMLDIGMPGMDGFELARKIRKVPGLRHLKLVALTGWGQEGVRRRSHKEGFDEHLLKPTSASELRTLLASVATP